MVYKNKEDQKAHDAAYYQEHKEVKAAYRQKHKVEIAAREVVYHQKHKDERRAYDAAYYLEHKDKKCAYNTTYRQEHKEEAVIRTMTHRLNHNEFVLNLIPNRCHFEGLDCRKLKKNGKETLLSLHEKSGNGHDEKAREIIYKNPERAEDFVRLCHKHHALIHGIMNFDKTWDEIEIFLNHKFVKHTE